MPQTAAIPALLVDAHVHVHPCFEIGAFLDAARANFAAAARELVPPDSMGCLLLAESSWHDYFRAFSRGLLGKNASRWTIRTTDESCSLIACHDGQPALFLIAGRQIITAERLEVLALVCERSFPDGVPIEAVLDSVRACGAVVVLPWALGKWWGKRGRKIEALLRSERAQHLFLGDNGGRPAIAAQPALFRLARDRGIAILAGTDPLALPWQVGKAGRYGFIMRQPVPLQTPAAALRSALCDSTNQPQTYGRRESLLGFVRANVALRLGKRGNASSPEPASLQR